MPKCCDICGLRLRADGGCGKESCKKFKPKSKDNRGTWLKDRIKQWTPRKLGILKMMTPPVKQSPLKASKPRHRIYRKSTAADLVALPSVDKDLNELPAGPTTLLQQGDDKDLRDHVPEVALPMPQHSEGHEAPPLLRNFVSDELLAGLVPKVRQRQFFDVVVRPSAGVHALDNVMPLSAALSMQSGKLLALIGEAQSLRILGQISAILNYIPATASLHNVPAYAAACVVIACELVSSWEDPNMLQFLRTTMSKDSQNVNRCIMQLLSWMGQPS